MTELEMIKKKVELAYNKGIVVIGYIEGSYRLGRLFRDSIYVQISDDKFIIVHSNNCIYKILG